MSLSASHQTVLLQDSAISPEVVEARGYRSVEDTTELRDLGLETYQSRVGLLIPGWCTDGENGFYVLRPDNPRVNQQKKKHNFQMALITIRSSSMNSRKAIQCV